MVLAGPGPGLRRPGGIGPPSRRRLAGAVTVGVLALVAYVADMLLHHPGQMLNWYDLNVYNHAGLIARQSPGRLYAWQLHPGIKFTYTPFAAVAFGAGSVLPWAVLKWLMTVASLAAIGGTGWLTLGALGWRGRRRVAAAAAIAAAGLWTEPVQRALHLGQIELLLMLLIVWDMCQPGSRRWKGAGVGVAAGIKLVPLIFIPYLVLARRLREAAVATAAFGGTVVIGFVFLPRASAKWWLTGYFLRPRNVGSVGSPLNQSLLGLLARASSGAAQATPLWLALSVVILAAGLAAAALLDRRGYSVAGWLTCALAGLLVSPISWDHHWVWVVPAIALLADAALRAEGAARRAWWALALGLAVLFGAWPRHYAGPAAFVPGGLLGFFVRPHPGTQAHHLHGVQVITWNLFVIAGLAMLVLAGGAAWRQRAAGRAGPAGRKLDRVMART